MKTVTDRLKGKPSTIRWVISAVTVWPSLAMRYFLIYGLIVLWMVSAPRVGSLVWTSTLEALATPNKKRTSKNSRPWQGPDEFDDVRARISELMQSPEQ